MCPPFRTDGSARRSPATRGECDCGTDSFCLCATRDREVCLSHTQAPQRSASKAWQSRKRFAAGSFTGKIERRYHMIHRIKIKTHERGLLWREGQLIDVLRTGVHWYLDPLLKLRLQV